MVSLFVLLMTAFQGTAFGQKATFSDCKLKHNVVTDGGKQLQCQYTARFSDMKSHKKIRIVMQVECPKGKVYKYLNNDGKNVSVTASKEYNNQYDRPILENKRLGIYNSRLHPKPGTNTYYVRLVAYELKTGKVIGRSGYMSFTNTGKSSAGNSGSNVNAGGKVSSAGKSGSKSKGKWAKISKGNYHVACAENACVYIGAKNKKMANGTNIELVGKFLEDDQQWYFLPENDYYYICSAVNRNYVLDVKKGVAAAGTNIQLYQRNNSEAQRWYLEKCFTDPKHPKENHEAYIIRSALNPDLVIEIEGGDCSFDSNIRLNRYSRKKSQMWRLE